MRVFIQIKVLVLVFLSLITLTNQCVYLQSGVTSITRSFNQEEYIFQFTPNFIAPNNRAIQAVASATNLQINWSREIDFQIVARHNPNTNRVVIGVYIPSQNSWNSIQISYFISGRSQFYLGTFYANVFIDSIIANGQSFNQVIPIQNFTPSNAVFKGVVQYSGMRVGQTNVAVTTNFLRVNASSGSLTMSIRIQPNSARVHYLVISYIVFMENPISHTSFQYFGTIPPADFVWIGIESINGVSSTFEGNSFSARNVNNGLICIGGLCGNQQCLTAQICSNLGGVASGNNCFRCRQGQVIINNQCAISTPNCRTNYVWNGVACVCRANFIEVNNVCYQTCGINAYIFNGNCICLTGFVFVGQECVRSCPLNQAINPVTNSCIQCVTQGHFIDNSICRCASTFVMTTNGCQACPPNSTPSPQTFSCTCNSGFQLVNNQCVPTVTCLPPQLLINGVCICPTGRALNPANNLCVPCQPNFIRNNVCVCPVPLVLTNTGCTALNCPPNSQLNPQTNTCQCLAGFQLVGNECLIVCSGGQIRLNNVCVCPPGQGINPLTNVCIACNNAGSFVQNNICRCAATHFPSPTGCQACIANSLYDPVARQCICNNGFFLNNNNVCTACHPACLTCFGSLNSQCTSCPTGVPLVNGSCNILICSPGFYIFNNQCLPCLPNCAVCSSATSCSTCQSGYALTTIGSAVSCELVCPAGTYRLNNQCLPCLANCVSCFNGNTCASCQTGYTLTINQTTLAVSCQLSCGVGFYRFNNQCLPCLVNCAVCSSATSCTSCATAYSLTTIGSTVSCELNCPAGFYRSNNQCLPCLQNCAACVNGVTCTSCSTGYALLAIGSVSTCEINCPAGTYRSNNQCLSCLANCAACSSATTCTSCQNGYALLSVGSTVTCELNCPSGYYRLNNQCLSCSPNCSACSSVTLCTVCQTGFSLTTAGSVVSCVATVPPTGLRLTLRSFVVGNSVIFQGVSINQLPAAVLQNNCNICNNLLLVTMVINPAINVVTTVEYISNSQYWFLIEFRFVNAAFIPAFEFKVQLNPIYANLFTPQDMAQNVFGRISQRDIYPQPPITGGARPLVRSTSSAPRPKTDIVNQIFGVRR